MKMIIAGCMSLVLLSLAQAVPGDAGDTAVQDQRWSKDASADTTTFMHETQTEADPGSSKDSALVSEAELEPTAVVPAERAAIAAPEKAIVSEGEANASKEPDQQIKKALNLETVGFGPGFPSGLQTDKLTYNFYGGKIWEVRAAAMVRANGELITDFRRAVYLAGNIGFGYFLPFSILEFSPYAAGEIGMGLARSSKDNSAFGFNLGAIFGVILFRSSDIQLSLETKAQTLLSDFKGGSPAGFSMRIGILF